MDTKICKTGISCNEGEPQSLGNFHANRKPGGQAYCKECRRKQNGIYYAAYKDKILSKKSGRSRERKRAMWIKSTYGLGPGDYENLLNQQNGVCAICGQLDKSGILDIDHDHSTGKVRGLLCGKCNTGIGQLRDDPVLCRKAAEYLESLTMACVAVSKTVGLE